MRILGGCNCGVSACLIALLIALLSSGLTFSQEPIHVAVNLVNVAFSARDARGALVDSRSKEDVEVYEDAVPQKFSFFAKSTDVPLTMGLVVDVNGSQDHYSKQIVIRPKQAGLKARTKTGYFSK